MANAARAALALGVLVASALVAHWGHPTVVEVNIFRLINELPSVLTAPLVGVMQLGALGAVPALGIAAGAVVNLCLGVPAKGPSIAHSTAVLGPGCLHPTGVATVEESDHLRWLAADGKEYFVKTLAGDRPDQGWLSRLWRMAAYRQPYAPLRARPATGPHIRPR